LSGRIVCQFTGDINIEDHLMEEVEALL